MSTTPAPRHWRERATYERQRDATRAARAKVAAERKATRDAENARLRDAGMDRDLADELDVDFQRDVRARTAEIRATKVGKEQEDDGHWLREAKREAKHLEKARRERDLKNAQHARARARAKARKTQPARRGAQAA